RVLVVTDELVELRQVEKDTREPVRERPVCSRDFDRVRKVLDAFLVCEQALGALTRAKEVGDRSRPGLAKVKVASQKIDDVVATSIQLLGGGRNSQVQVASHLAQQARVGDVLHE